VGASSCRRAAWRPRPTSPRSLARQLADGFLVPEDVQLYQWRLANGAGPPLPFASATATLVALAVGRLEAPREFFEGREPALLPAVGAAARRGSARAPCR